MPSPRKPNLPRAPQSQRNAATLGQAFKPPRNAAPAPGGGPQLSGAPQLIDPRWIVKALALVFAVALLLAWGTLCLLWYQGQWQLVLHPSRAVATKPNQFLFPCNDVNFFDDAVGHPQLDGWLCPNWNSAGPHGEMLPGIDPNVPTVLFLHGADGSISDALPRAFTLHNAHLNVLLFDYRGYGRSIGQHPVQATMQLDAEAALNFLTNREGVPVSRIIVYGQGIGASVAVQLAAEHRSIPAIILDAPDGDLLDRAARDPRSRLVPARLLFHETFPLAEQLHTLNTPKLLISYTSSIPSALANAADPKTTIEVPSPKDPALIPAIQRFLDLYLHISLPAPSPAVHTTQPLPNVYPPS